MYCERSCSNSGEEERIVAPIHARIHLRPCSVGRCSSCRRLRGGCGSMIDMRLSLHTVSRSTREAGALPPSLAGDHSGRRVRPLPGGRVRVTGPPRRVCAMLEPLPCPAHLHVLTVWCATCAQGALADASSVFSVFSLSVTSIFGMPASAFLRPLERSSRVRCHRADPHACTRGRLRRSADCQPPS